MRFFGDYTVFALPAISAGARIPDRGAVVPFLSGLQLGWHARRGAAGGAASSAHAQRFLRALFELRAYMTVSVRQRKRATCRYFAVCTHADRAGL